MVSGPPTMAALSAPMPTSTQAVVSRSIDGATSVDADRIELAEQRADEQRSEKQPAAKAGRQRDEAGEQFQHDEDRQFRRSHRPVEVEPERAVARPQNLRGVERHRADHQPADDGANEAPGDRRPERPFDQRRHPHRADPDRRRDQAEHDQRAVVRETSAGATAGAVMS